LETADQLRQALLVGVTSGAVTVGSNPFGVLVAQVFVNLLLKLAVRMNLVGHDNFLDKGQFESRFRLTPQIIVYYHPAAIAHAWDFALLLER
jgi:hypothetical protein